MATTAEDDDNKQETDFSQFGVLGALMKITKQHKDFMASQDKAVEDYIFKSKSQKLLRDAKRVALSTERELMDELMNDLDHLNGFLKDIILIENLFNSIFDGAQRQQQQQARAKYAPNIAEYEQKPKPTSKCDSFMELMFAGSSLYLSAFKKFIVDVEEECVSQHIKVQKNSGAQSKNLERAFYKTFYVYALQHGEEAHQQMTDVLRCSLVFDDFAELYRCFAVIESMAKNDPNLVGGILRCKDRYNPDRCPFGYRDLLLNVYCPGSDEAIVCEIQLHHMLFYQYKKISHRMYKRARLFEDAGTGENLAYKHADVDTRQKIGDSKYDVQADDEEGDEEAMYVKTLQKWGLEMYVATFEEEGYTDTAGWTADELTEDDLKEMGLKRGHIKQFLRKRKEDWESGAKPTEPEAASVDDEKHDNVTAVHISAAQTQTQASFKKVQAVVYQSDAGSAAKKDAKFYKPASLQPGEYNIGVICKDFTDNSAAILVIANAKEGVHVKRPIRCERVWNDAGSGLSQNYQLWRPIAPPGFVAMSDIPNFGTSVSNDVDSWGTDQIWCVSEALVTRSEISSRQWTDAGTGAKKDGAIWNVKGTNFMIATLGHQPSDIPYMHKIPSN